MPAILTAENGLSVELNVSKEQPQRSNDIPDNAVESGVAISDHVKSRPTIYRISGTVTGDDAAKKLGILDQFKENGLMLTYVGRNYLPNVAIQDFSSDHDVTNRHGFYFDITLKQIRVAVKEIVTYTGPDPATTKESKQQTAPVKNKGTQQPTIKKVNENMVANWRMIESELG